ncbi:hypothetical protein PAMA_021361 [Pampus argenteus]
MRHVWHACCFLRLCGDRAVLEAAGKIPESWTPCGRDMAITASNPSSAGMGHISVGLWLAGRLLCQAGEGVRNISTDLGIKLMCWDQGPAPRKLSLWLKAIIRMGMSPPVVISVINNGPSVAAPGRRRNGGTGGMDCCHNAINF